MTLTWELGSLRRNYRSAMCRRVYHEGASSVSMIDRLTQTLEVRWRRSESLVGVVAEVGDQHPGSVGFQTVDVIPFRMRLRSCSCHRGREGDRNIQKSPRVGDG